MRKYNTTLRKNLIKSQIDVKNISNFLHENDKENSSCEDNPSMFFSEKDKGNIMYFLLLATTFFISLSSNAQIKKEITCVKEMTKYSHSYEEDHFLRENGWTPQGDIDLGGFQEFFKHDSKQTITISFLDDQIALTKKVEQKKNFFGKMKKESFSFHLAYSQEVPQGAPMELTASFKGAKSLSWFSSVKKRADGASMFMLLNQESMHLLTYLNYGSLRNNKSSYESFACQYK